MWLVAALLRQKVFQSQKAIDINLNTYSYRSTLHLPCPAADKQIISQILVSKRILLLQL